MTYDLPAILEKYGVSLRKSGTGFVAKCIAHEDHNPSMSVYINGSGKYTTHCHSCGFHEDAIGVVAHMENISMAEAMKMLGNDTFVGHGAKRGKIEVRKPKRICSVPTADAGRPRMDYLIDRDTGESFGEPEEVFVYRTHHGEPWYYEARFVVNGKKQPRVFTWGTREGQEPKWECAHYTGELRPLYGLDSLSAKPKAQIVIAEGPRKASAAQKLLPRMACIGWSGGASSWNKSDWSQVSDKNVIIWPDNDSSGKKCAESIATMLVDQGCTVHILNVDDMPESWDVADALSEGWTTEDTMAWCKSHKGDKFVKPAYDEAKEIESDVDISEPISIPDDTPPIEAYFGNIPLNVTWQHPLDIFSALQSPQVEAEMLPECITEWAFDLEGVKGVDRSMLAFTAIIASAALLHDKIKVQPESNNPTWRESARLWGAIVGDASIRKTPAIIEGLREVGRIDDELCDRAAAQKYKNMLIEKVHIAKEKEYLQEIASGKDVQPPEPPKLVQVDRVRIQSSTIEAIEEAAKTCDRGFLVDRDELVSWFGSMDAYKSRAGSDRGAWLEFYNGGSRRVDRIGRGSFKIDNWGGCVIGGIQPGPMKELAGQINEDGLLQRFIILLARPAEEGNDRKPNLPAIKRVYDMHRQIFRILPSTEIVKLTPEAEYLRKEISRKAFSMIRTGFISPSFCSHLGKWDGMAARLMLTFHAMECADKQIHPQSVPVSEMTAGRVRNFMLDFMLPNSITFYDELMQDDVISQHVRAVGRLILSRNEHKLSTRDLFRGWGGWRCITDKQKDQVLTRLTEAGWIMTDPVMRTYKDRPVHYLVNPNIHKVYEEKVTEELSRRKTVREYYEKIRRVPSTRF